MLRPVNIMFSPLFAERLVHKSIRASRPPPWNRFRSCNQYRFTSTASAEHKAVQTASKDIGESAADAAKSKIIRHGPGDGVITLNVGGKEFITLRSTVHDNPILWSHVTKAEANQEFTKGAVFIDRDAAHFGLILQHLRNRADGIQRNPGMEKFFSTKKSVTIQIPKDADARRDLFMEARYFQIKELEDILCSYDVYTQIASFMGSGAGNPFVAASEVLKNVRRMLLATGGTGIFVGTMNEDLRRDINKVWQDLKFMVTGGKKEDTKELPASSEPSIS